MFSKQICSDCLPLLNCTLSLLLFPYFYPEKIAKADLLLKGFHLAKTSQFCCI